MKRRCNCPSQESFEYYGGRGISYDPRWEKFEAFLEDMGEKPCPSDSLDRIDHDGRYEKANCRWTDIKTQNRNRRNTVYLTLGERTMSLPEWVEETGLKYDTLRYRLALGWSDERALTAPVRRKAA